MLDAYFNEREADQAVIRSLIQEVNKLRSILMPIVKTTDGKYYSVDENQELSTDQVKMTLTDLKLKSEELESLLTPEQPVVEPVQVPVEQTVPEQPAPAVEQPVAPETAVATAPVDQPVVQPEPVVLS
jgi:hypothetical protein